MLRFFLSVLFITVFVYSGCLFGKEGKSRKSSDVSSMQKQNSRRAPAWISQMLSKLTKSEKARLRHLQETDPQSFKAEVKKLVKKYKPQSSDSSRAIMSLIKKYHAAEDETEKNEIQAKIRDLVRKQFDTKMAINKKRYQEIAKKLQQLKKKIEEREANADAIIKQHVKDLTKDPALAW